jgi:hypothetical protein
MTYCYSCLSAGPPMLILLGSLQLQAWQVECYFPSKIGLQRR